ncbi:MAG: 50S ribosomal protein L5 [Candidatus Colwellbacteria bacterium]|nr:50S ribosomal protein L5 [Candidatus Colwellbacteria bacterium]MBI3273979.1 50S ribosomal protein L5 [Candidatus Colwellbacteria bacterium]
MQSNKLEKIVVSVGVGRMRNNPQFEEKVLPEIVKELSLIIGQHPATRGAKKSIAAFKTREGDTVGLTATLRGKRMRDFLFRLTNIALPRVRDFRGVDTKSFDARGNLTMGIKEHTVFPEINPETSKFNFGMEITIVGKTKSKEEGIELSKTLGVPLKKG